MPRRCALPALAASLLAAACSSTPPPAYHTLLDDASLPAQPPAAYALEVAPVSIPSQADQPQVMLRGADGQIRPLYGERWSAPLGDEIQSALGERLTQRLGAPNVTQIGAGGMPVWRVQVDVQRFDLPLDAPVALDLTWRIRELPAQPALLCASRLRVAPQGSDVAAAVAAQRRAIGQAADLIAASIAAGGAAPTGAAAQDTHTQCSSSPAQERQGMRGS
ncbi:PqiC family protein [Verticiella sediminum]|nr:PqiC family protein [Verticiella sediminum]